MEPLTSGVQQLIGLTCSGLFAGWFVLAVGDYALRWIVDAMSDWID